MNASLLTSALHELGDALHHLAAAIGAPSPTPMDAPLGNVVLRKRSKEPAPHTKTAKAINLAFRPEGATDDELVQITKWSGGPANWTSWFVRADGSGYAQRLGYHYRNEKLPNGGFRRYLTRP